LEVPPASLAGVDAGLAEPQLPPLQPQREAIQAAADHVGDELRQVVVLALAWRPGSAALDHARPGLDTSLSSRSNSSSRCRENCANGFVAVDRLAHHQALAARQRQPEVVAQPPQHRHPGRRDGSVLTKFGHEPDEKLKAEPLPSGGLHHRGELNPHRPLGLAEMLGRVDGRDVRIHLQPPGVPRRLVGALHDVHLGALALTPPAATGTAHRQPPI
jgi:hypothetical protein